MRWFKDANYDFMTKRRLVMLISIVPIIIGLISIAVKGGLETSIDFAGGMLVEVGFGNPVTVQEVQAALGDLRRLTEGGIAGEGVAGG